MRLREIVPRWVDARENYDPMTDPIIGRVSNTLRVISLVHPKRNRHREYLCRCKVCDKECFRRAYRIRKETATCECDKSYLNS